MRFQLSTIAKLDLDDIYDYSLGKFGFDKTIQYFMEMENVFRTISSNPKIGTEREYLNKGIFAFPYQSHMIFYRLLSSKEVVIERIIHGSKDIPKEFIK